MTSVRLTHIGGPTTLVEFAGWRILTDPTFDPPGRTYRFGWGTSSRKVIGPALAADDLGPIDAVLLTHEHHADNLDAAGRAMLPRAGVVITTTSGAAALGGTARGLAPWATTTLKDSSAARDAKRPAITVTATPCRHGPIGSHPIVGDVIGFSLRWDGQAHGDLWWSGDTVLYRGVREVATRLSIGTAIVHIGGVRFGLTGPIRYTMTAQGAIGLLDQIRPHTTVPVHYEGWSHFHESSVAARTAFAEAPEPVRSSVRWVAPGDVIELDV